MKLSEDCCGMQPFFHTVFVAARNECFWVSQSELWNGHPEKRVCQLYQLYVHHRGWWHTELKELVQEPGDSLLSSLSTFWARILQTTTLCYTHLGRPGGALVPWAPDEIVLSHAPCFLLPLLQQTSLPPFCSQISFAEHSLTYFQILPISHLVSQFLCSVTTFSCYENCFLNFSLLFFDPSILSPIGACLSPIPHCFPSQQTSSSLGTSLPPAAPQALLLHPHPLSPHPRLLFSHI